MYQTPWYTKAADILHRATVLVLAGSTVYMIGGVSYTLYKNGQQRKAQAAKLQEEVKRQAELIEEPHQT